MSLQNSSCFGFLHFPSSTFKKLSKEAITSASFAPDSGYLISESSELFQLLLPSLEKRHLFDHVQQVSCNSTAVAFVTASGFLFTLGEDQEKWGTLALKNIYSIRNPTRVQINTRITSVSLGQKHGAVLTDKGELYTWGTGCNGELGSCIKGNRILPSVVQTAKIFLIKQVLVSGNLTGFVTAGGFVYLYGELPRSSCGLIPNRQPYTIKGMAEHFIVNIEMNKDFLVMLSDKKQVFLSDGNMNVDKLPYFFSKVACSDDSIVGIGNNDGMIHKFYIGDRNCWKANELVESAYFVNEVFSHKFSLFSGYFVSCAFISQNQPIDKVNLQTLSLEKVQINDLNFRNFPDITYKKTIGKTVNVLNSKRTNLLKVTLIDLKVFAKFRGMVLEKSLDSILMAVWNRLMKKALIIKRNAFNRYLGFIELSKKHYEIKLFKRKQAIENCIIKIYRKCFWFLVSSFELHQLRKNRKNHIAEKIFSFFAQKKSETKRQGFFLVKSFVTSKKVMKKKLSKLFNLLQVSLKLKFISNLVQNHVEKLKIYKVITQMIAYSEAQGFRAKLIKYFQLWRQNIVYLKIAKISQKYLTNVKLKKMTDILATLLRSSVKSSFTQIKKNKKKSGFKFKIIFFINSIFFVLNPQLVLAFQRIKFHGRGVRKFQRLINAILKPRFQSLTQEINRFISSRKIILIMKIITRKLTRSSNYELRVLFKAFIKLASFYEPRASTSPSSTFNDSPKCLQAKRTSNLCLAISTAKPKKNTVVQKKLKSLVHPADFVGRSSNKKKTCPPNLSKAVKYKSKTKRSIISPTLSPLANSGLDISIDSLTELSPRSVVTLREAPKKAISWELQLYTLSLVKTNTLLKARLKFIFKSLLNY